MEKIVKYAFEAIMIVLVCSGAITVSWKFLELITFDVIMEALGAIFGIGIIWKLFFDGGLTMVFEIVGQALCGG